MIDGRKCVLQALAALAFCTTGAVAPALAAGPDWQIGFISSTSGPLKGVGDSTATAIAMAAAAINAKGGINGRQIHLNQYDTGGEPKQASVGARTLTEDSKVLAIVGPLSSGEA